MANWNPSDPSEPITFDKHDLLGTSSRISHGSSSEPPRANRALCDYLFLGPSCTFEKLLETYASDPSAPKRLGNFSAESVCPSAPTHSIDRICVKRWSLAYSWVARAFSFDEIQRKNDNHIYTERRRSINETGLALDFCTD